MKNTKIVGSWTKVLLDKDSNRYTKILYKDSARTSQTRGDSFHFSLQDNVSLLLHISVPNGL